MVDEGWGRRAVDFAVLCEPQNCREYVAIHQRLALGDGVRLLDVACGSGLAIELARIQGATCCGIDASQRLVAVARDRNPDSDIRVGDMKALPWEDESFDVVTMWDVIEHLSDPLTELKRMHRVLKPNGLLAVSTMNVDALFSSPGRSSQGRSATNAIAFACP